MSTTKVLSIDGGGIRGVIPAVVLTEIERRTDQPISELFDIAAGTSTGGILACGLAMPGDDGKPAFSAQESLDIYRDEGDRIFDRYVFKKIEAGHIPGISDSPFEEKYPSDGLRSVLEEKFGRANLAEATMDLVVPTYDLLSRDPWIWRTQEAKEKAHTDRPLWEVAFSTSVAPTYFEPYHFADATGTEYTLVDGGIYANNPAMMGVTEATVQGAHLHDMVVVSLGTGRHNEAFPYEDAREWGDASWAKPAVKCAMDGSTDAAHVQCREMFDDDRYFRVQTRLEEASDAMDDASTANLANLETEAEQILEHQEETIARIVERLTS